MILLGSLFAVLSAFTFALNGASVRRGVLTGTVAQAMAITVPMGVPMFFLGALALGALDDITAFSANTVALLAAAGVVHFVWGRYCNYRATKAIGSNASTPLQQMDFPFKLGLAIVFLGESLTPLRIFGIGLIMLGGAVAIKRRKKKPATKAAAGPAAAAVGEPAPKSAGAAAAPHTPVFVPNYVEGYTFALLSITGYGLSPLFVRMALEDTSIGTSLAGGFISYVAATIVIALTWLKPGQFVHVLSVNRSSVRWFVLSALFVGVSQMFRYMSLALAPITVVAPIQRSAGLFKVVINWFMNRQHEVFEPRLLIGIVISVLGGVALTISTDFVIAHVPLPAYLIEIAHWTWP